MTEEVVPSWPRIEALAREDGTGEVVVDGTPYPIAEQSLDQARVAIIGRVTRTAEELGRPVRVSTDGPDGHWPLIVHPNGHVAADGNPAESGSDQAGSDSAGSDSAGSDAVGAPEHESTATGQVAPGVPTLPNQAEFHGSPVPQSPRTALRQPNDAVEAPADPAPESATGWNQEDADDSLIGELLGGDPPQPDSAVEVTPTRRLDWKSVWEPSDRWNLRKTKDEELPKLRFHESSPAADQASPEETSAVPSTDPANLTGAASNEFDGQARTEHPGSGAETVKHDETGQHGETGQNDADSGEPYAAPQTGPEQSGPGQTDPDPVPADPVRGETEPSDPARSVPAPFGPVESGPVESGPVESGPAHPGPAHSGAAHPDATQPGPAAGGADAADFGRFGVDQGGRHQSAPDQGAAQPAGFTQGTGSAAPPAPDGQQWQPSVGPNDGGATGAGPDRNQQRQSFLVQEAAEEPASRGFRGFLTRAGIKVGPNELERSERSDMAAVSQHWPGPRTIAVVNGKGGAGKTPTTILLSAVFALFGGAGVAAWDNNQTRGTLGWRTEQGSHQATLLDLLPEVPRLLSTGAQAADLAHFVHHQTRDRFDVLRSQPMVLAHEQRIEPRDVDAIHAVLGKYYRLIFIDSGNDESDPMWLRMIDHADQLVVATTTRNDHAEAGALLLEALAGRDERSARLARESVAVITQADPNATAADLRRVTGGYQPLTRATVGIPFDPGMVDGLLLHSQLKPETRRAWLAAGAAVAEGL